MWHSPRVISKTAPARRSATKSWTDDRHDRRTRDDRGWHIFSHTSILSIKIAELNIPSSPLPVFWVNLYSLVNLYSKFKFNDSRMLLSADAYEYEQQAKPR